MVCSSKQFRKRNAILAYLRSTDAHPSAETVFTALKQEIPDLSMGTVYRNLHLFQQQGLAACIATVNGVERFDGCTVPHVHFVCHRCGGVTDLPGLELPPALRRGAQHCCGGQVTDFQLSFSGLCKNCMSSGESA